MSKTDIELDMQAINWFTKKGAPEGYAQSATGENVSAPRSLSYFVTCPVCDYCFCLVATENDIGSAREWGGLVLTHIALCGMKGGVHTVKFKISVPVRLDRKEF